MINQRNSPWMQEKTGYRERSLSQGNIIKMRSPAQMCGPSGVDRQV
jgi:hypothetical protein